MKGFIKSKKGIALLATLVVAAAAAIGAYAYFSSSGTGTGSATVGSSTAFVVTETMQSGGPLYPDPSIGGANIQTNTYTVHNPSAGNQQLNQVVISILNGDTTAWVLCHGETPSTSTVDGSGNCTNGDFVGEHACTKADFSVGGQTAGSSYTDTSQAGDLTAGQTVTSSVTVEMIDNLAAQDNCQGAAVPLYYSAS